MTTENSYVVWIQCCFLPVRMQIEKGINGKNSKNRQIAKTFCKKNFAYESKT